MSSCCWLAQTSLWQLRPLPSWSEENISATRMDSAVWPLGENGCQYVISK